MWCKVFERFNFPNAPLGQGVRQGLQGAWRGPQQFQRALKAIGCNEARILIVHFNSSLYA
jgi:hypothetical protein